MKKLDLTERDWLALNDQSLIIAKKIKSRLPDDWKLAVDDIRTYVYDAYIAILNSYDPSKKIEGTSFCAAAYCWKYAEKATYSGLMQEYHKLKLQDTLYAIGELDDGDDDDFCTHKRGKADVSETTDFPMKKIEDKDLLGKLYDSCNDVDTRHAIACMYFLDWSLTQTAKECKMTKQTLLARLRAIGKRFTK